MAGVNGRMSVRDELVRAAVVAGADARTVVRVHRLAPIVEHSIALQCAAHAAPVVEALVAERHRALLQELQDTRRQLTLAIAQIAALEVLA